MCLPDKVSTFHNNIYIYIQLYPLSAFGLKCIIMIYFPFLYRFLNEAMKMFDATEIVPINFVFFTASAVIAGTTTYMFNL